MTNAAPVRYPCLARAESRGPSHSLVPAVTTTGSHVFLEPPAPVQHSFVLPDDNVAWHEEERQAQVAMEVEKEQELAREALMQDEVESTDISESNRLEEVAAKYLDAQRAFLVADQEYREALEAEGASPLDPATAADAREEQRQLRHRQATMLRIREWTQELEVSSSLSLGDSDALNEDIALAVAMSLAEQEAQQEKGKRRL